MEIYISLLIISLLASFLLRKSKLVGIIFIILLFFISASRGERVGLDTENYYNNVFSSFYEGETHKLEFLFIGFCDFIRDNGLNSRCCVYLLSFLTFLFVYLSARRFHVNITIVCFFYLLFLYFTHSLCIARQMAACSILLFAYSFLFEDIKTVGERGHKIKNIAYFLLFALLATSIHSGAFLGFLVIVVYFLQKRITIIYNNLKCSPLTVFLVLFVSFAVIQLFRNTLLSEFQGILAIIDMYEGYTTVERAISLFGFLYNSIVFLFHAYVLVYLFKTGDNKLATFFLVSLFLRIFLTAFNGAIYRLIFYFSIIDIIVYSKCFLYLSSRSRIVFWMALLYFGVDYVLVLVNNPYETVPYVFKMIEIL